MALPPEEAAVLAAAAALSEVDEREDGQLRDVDAGRGRAQRRASLWASFKDTRRWKSEKHVQGAAGQKRTRKSLKPASFKLVASKFKGVSRSVRNAALGRYSQKKDQSSDKDAPESIVLGDYSVQSCIGQGSFGTVFLATCSTRPAEDVFAIKVLEKRRVLEKCQVENSLAELQIISQYCDHPFLLSLKESFQSDSVLCMVTEFCRGGEVFFHLNRLGAFSENIVYLYAAQIVDALSHLHMNGVVYRDLKSENMLLDERGFIKLADFGLSKVGVEEFHGSSSICGSVSYMAPEMIRCHRSLSARNASPEEPERSYGYMVDFWSLGTLLYDMLFGQPPFYDTNKAIMFKRVLSSEKVSFPQGTAVSEQAKEFLGALLKRNPERRLGSSRKGGIRTLRTHPFFRGLDWDALHEKRLDVPRPSTFLALECPEPDSQVATPPSQSRSRLLSNVHTSFLDLPAQEFLETAHAMRFLEWQPECHRLRESFASWDISLASAEAVYSGISSMSSSSDADQKEPVELVGPLHGSKTKSNLKKTNCAIC